MHPNPSKPLFFIIGNPRSGTTLLRLLLDSHSEVAVPPECGFAHWMYARFGDTDFSSRESRLEYADALFALKKIETWGMDRQKFLSAIQSEEIHDYRDMTCCVYRFYATMRNKKGALFGDKNNYYIQHIPEIDQIFDTPQKICIIRDGRDVACSYLRMARLDANLKYAPKLPETLAAIADEWSANAKIVGDCLKRGAYLVRYEDLVTYPEKELQGVCSFLRIDFERTMLDFHKHNTEPETFMAWKAQTRNPINKDAVAIYRRELTPPQLAAFEAVAGEQLRAFGYQKA